MGGLELFELVHQGIVFSIGDLRFGILIVERVVMLELLTQLENTFLRV